ncbi:unnamed protein product [Rotaria magnacalcarata]|uniref:G-protein coupled receptors family 1 profile domain-containing protein n=1 Tax=Rotaria magnacalcarata TaxID=392030 RepID=A0A815HH85_9BILA|nr:unnamed protein product [Rotaria magnacalcarata]CAF1644044.1 unnamed protein product [Rotaria magnacalcarata]CAF2027573.1 unnamed protein product [Rotaria magnacalcarata]CAF2043782.1 unnamed protein product [Rotaria magnacalcarata]CAF2135154.1 unnamed protein product [Rotaria magnacalcarata]
MENASLPFDNTTDYNWCLPWTKPIYLYGHLIPAIALFIFGVTFNPIALYYFATSRNFRRTAYSYYFSTIAFVDLVRLIIWCLFLLLDYKIFKLHFHSFECSTQIFAESVTSSISAWLTASLAIERCLAVSIPFQTYTDTRGKRALIIIPSVVLASCAINSLFLQTRFYEKRVYVEETRTIICYYNTLSKGNLKVHDNPLILTANIKRIYLLFIVIIRVAIPFMLLLTANIILLGSVRKSEKQSTKYAKILLVRHGRQRQITPMILFSSCIILLTISPRYLLQFYFNFFQQSFNCSLIHFAPHLLKTLELFNYSFNVFVSVVSGKHARRELFNMLSCRSTSLNSKYNGSSEHYSPFLSKMSYQNRSKHNTHSQMNSNNAALLTNNTDFH